MKKNKIMPILFLTWFFASILALIHFSKINGYYAVMIFGQLFLGMGLLVLSTNGKEGLIAIVHVLIGLVLIIIPFLMMHPEIIGTNVNWNIIIPILFLLVFIAAGIFMISFSFIRRMYLKKVCTLEIDAVIYEKAVVNYGDILYLYKSTYSFQYNNEDYKVAYMTPKRNDDAPRGTFVKIKIDPNNPNNFLYNYPINYGLIIMGIIFISFASFALSLII